MRFVCRLNPLPRDKLESLMMRLVSSLTHQRVVINGVTYPDETKNKFPKLRGGTADSTLKFLLKLLDLIENGGVDPDNIGGGLVGGEEEDEDDAKIDNLATSVKLRDIANGNSKQLFFQREPIHTKL